MKKHLLFIFSFLLLQFTIVAQSYEILDATRDTINYIGSDGKKQGKWIVKGWSQRGSGYMPKQKIEEGYYKDNKKTGVWTQYHKNGNIKNILTFEGGRPNGPAKMFYESGKISEEGIWKNNRWVGPYKKYTEDGKVEEHVFDDNGKEIAGTKPEGIKNKQAKTKKQ